MNMKLLKKLYHEILLPACLVFTVLCVALSLVGDGFSLYVHIVTLLRFLLFSVIFAASWQLFQSKKIPFGGALVLHFIAFLLNVSIVMIALGGQDLLSRGSFYFLLLLSLVYVIIATVAVTVRHFVLVSKESKKKYKRQF